MTFFSETRYVFSFLDPKKYSDVWVLHGTRYDFTTDFAAKSYLATLAMTMPAYMWRAQKITSTEEVQEL